MDQLNEGCVCRVYLLNGELIEIVLNKKHTIGDLLTYANRQCELPTQSWIHFGLAYIDEYQQIVWMSSDEYIIQYPFPKCVAAFSQVNLHHFVRYFPRSFVSVTNAVTLLYLFYDARIQFLKGYLVQDLTDFIQCSSSLIILCNGQLDLDTDEISDILNEQIHPSVKLLRTFDTSLDQICTQIKDEIRRLRCNSQGNLIMHFLKHAESSKTYGGAFYNVSDNQQRALTLSINSKAIVLFDSSNMYQPKKIFDFGNIDNITWKENVFTIQMRGHQSPDKFSHSNGTKTLPNRSLQKNSFVCLNAQQCKILWSAAVSQHFMEEQLKGKPSDCKQRLSDQLEELLESSTKLASIASTSSIDSYSTIGRSSMPPSSVRLGTLSSTSLSINKAMSAEEKEQLTQKYHSLKVKLKAIEDELITQLNELKGICLEEAQITGQMPKEIFMTLLPGEKLPPVTKRVGTAFKIDPQIIENSNGTDRLVQLQADIQLHRKIVQAAERLANDKSTNKSVRRKRKKDLQAAAMKLRGLEKGLYHLRMSASKPDIPNSDYSVGQFSRNRAGSGFSLNSLKNWPNFISGSGNKVPKSCPTTPRGSVHDLTAPTDHPDKLFALNNLSRSKHVEQLGNQRRQPIEIQPSCLQIPASTSGLSLPPVIPNRRLNSIDQQHPKGSGPNSSSASEFPTYTNIGYKSSVPYKSAYRQQNYPTLGQYQIQRSKSVACSPGQNLAAASTVDSSSTTMFFAQRNVPQQRPTILPVNGGSNFTSSFPSSKSNSAIEAISKRKMEDGRLVDNLSAIVSHMNQAAAGLRLQQQQQQHRVPQRVVLRNSSLTRDLSTTSLDHRPVKDPNSLQTELHQGNQQRDSVSSGVSSASSSSNASPTSISRTTTFPVEYNYPRQQTTPRLGLSVSLSRVQPTNFGNQKLSQFDPRMENLLASIHSRAAMKMSGREDIPPLQRQNPSQENSPTKTATVV